MSIFSNSTPCPIKQPLVRSIIGILLFFIAYAVLNYRLIVVKVLYRWATNDLHSAFSNVLSFGFQSFVLLVLVVMLPARALVTVLTAVAISGMVNAAYVQVLGDIMDLSAMSWMLEEYRQLIPALNEFWPSFLVASAKIGVVLGLLYLTRRLIAPVIEAYLLPAARVKSLWPGLVAFFVVADPAIAGISSGRGAEFNAFVLALKSYMQVYPERQQVDVKPQDKPQVKKIVWLVDESISSTFFHSVMQSRLTKNLGAIDYGDSTSFANCSAQSNAALRWGVNVGAIDRKTDLRRSASIWGFASSAGYNTILIDGQVSGAPQNLIWPPERKLINEFFPAKSDIYTDHKIARKVNEILKRSGKDFVYVVFRGAHYQYHSNYPDNDIPFDSPLEAKYSRAIEFSKSGVFEELFSGVDRSEVAVFYTSDHGQVLKEGIIPHCNTTPYAEEFSVPLLAFMPPALLDKYSEHHNQKRVKNHSHSQIFPTSLILMGYPYKYAAEQYDNPLPAEPKRRVTFGKLIVANEEGGEIDVRIDKEYQPLATAK